MGPIPAETSSAQPQSVLLEESQEGSEWAIRIGDALPPAWGKKRSLTREDTLVEEPKRKRVDSGYVSCPPPSRLFQLAPLPGVTSVPCILQCLLMFL